MLIECIDSNSGNTWHFKGKVSLQILVVVPSLLVIHYAVDQTMVFLMRHRRQVNKLHVAIKAQSWGEAGRDM